MGMNVSVRHLLCKFTGQFIHMYLVFKLNSDGKVIFPDTFLTHCWIKLRLQL